MRQVRLIFRLQASDGRNIQTLSQTSFKTLSRLGVRENKMPILRVKADRGLDTGIFLTDIIDLFTNIRLSRDGDFVLPSKQGQELINSLQTEQEQFYCLDKGPDRRGNFWMGLIGDASLTIARPREST